MNQNNLEFQEEETYSSIEQNLKDVRIISMKNDLFHLKKSRKGEYSMKDLRDICPKLFNLTYRSHCDSNTLKAKGTWTVKPEDWPPNVFFGDPNNKNTSGSKPKEAELRPMFNFLLNKFNNMHNCTSIESTDYNSSYLCHSDTPSLNESMLKDGSLIFKQNESCVDFSTDENFVISTNSAQSPNSEVDIKYKKLKDILDAMNYLDENIKETFAYILKNLATHQKTILLDIFEVLLKNITKLGCITDDIYKTITDNYADIINQRKQPGAQSDGLALEEFEDLIELQEVDNLSEYLLVNYEPLWNKINYMEKDASEENIAVQMSNSFNNNLDNLISFNNESYNSINNQAFENVHNFGVNQMMTNTNDELQLNQSAQALMVTSQNTEVPWDIHQIMNLAGSQIISQASSDDYMELDLDYGSVGNQNESSSYGSQIPLTVENYDENFNHKYMKGRRGK